MSIVENKKARFDYEIAETLEAGIVLRGFEVKAVKAGKVSMSGAYAKLYDGELWLVNMDISPYQKKNTPDDYEQERPRKLLMRKDELKKLTGTLKEKGLTLVPLKLYNRGNLVKVELGLGKSKKKTDKRAVIKKRDMERDLGRKLKGR